MALWFLSVGSNIIRIWNTSKNPNTSFSSIIHYCKVLQKNGREWWESIILTIKSSSFCCWEQRCPQQSGFDYIPDPSRGPLFFLNCKRRIKVTSKLKRSGFSFHHEITMDGVSVSLLYSSVEEDAWLQERHIDGCSLYDPPMLQSWPWRRIQVLWWMREVLQLGTPQHRGISEVDMRVYWWRRKKSTMCRRYKQYSLTEDSILLKSKCELAQEGGWSSYGPVDAAPTSSDSMSSLTLVV